MGNRLFGTDGIRGQAGVCPLDEMTIRHVACAVAGRQLRRSPGTAFLIARDTRASGPWIRDLVRQEFEKAGVEVLDAGVLPTPAVARLVRKLGCGGGLMISASHNPAQDNGLKFLSASGSKLEDTEEAAIEAGIPHGKYDLTIPLFGPLAPGQETGKAEWSSEYAGHLMELLAETGFPRGVKVLVDCANGAASPVARILSERWGDAFCCQFDCPDGFNINEDCGATHPEALAEAVREAGACLGLCLDGDADRLIVIGPQGQIVDGDALLYIFASHLQDSGRLVPARAVGTVMTNAGLESAFRSRGIELIRTPVGDRFLQREIQMGNAIVGAESSGHILLGHLAGTGDGLLAGLFLLSIIAETGRDLPGLLDGYRPFPSRMLNIRALQKPDPVGLAPMIRLQEGLNELEEGSWRLVVRYSGTEPLLRIMVEARDLERLNPLLDGVARDLGVLLGAN